MGRYYFGQIVETYISDGHGHTKARPVVILSDDRECDEGGPILVVMISKSPTDPRPDYHVQVHDRFDEDPTTGLYYPCWAKCNVCREIELKRILRTWDHMPDRLLAPIVETFDRLMDDPDFDDWQ